LSFICLTSTGAVDEEILAAVEQCLLQNFSFEVRRVEPFPDPEYAYDAKSGQYLSSLIVKELVQKCPAGAVRFFAVTEKDLFIPMLTFIFGQAQLDGRVAIISLARLRQEFYRLPPNKTMLISRVMKETLHEMGHTFGLVHCRDRQCTMSLATNLQQLDSKGGRFCRTCELTLQEKITMMHRETAGSADREALR
jgi:archaemetzincin